MGAELAGALSTCSKSGISGAYSLPHPAVASLTTLPSLVFRINDVTVAVAYIKLKLTIVCDRS